MYTFWELTASNAAVATILAFVAMLLSRVWRNESRLPAHCGQVGPSEPHFARATTSRQIRGLENVSIASIKLLGYLTLTVSINPFYTWSLCEASTLWPKLYLVEYCDLRHSIDNRGFMKESVLDSRVNVNEAVVPFRGNQTDSSDHC